MHCYNWMAAFHFGTSNLMLLATNLPSRMNELINKRLTHLLFVEERGPVRTYEFATGKTILILDPSPHWFGASKIIDDRVVFVETNTLCSTKLDGTDRKKLFPPD
ncbi:MAG: hypothetical protein CMO80_12355 [Verrucomicrobiales bacterium]|nr:hypothetical protein [Verrucomicrobiales bacterium]